MAAEGLQVSGLVAGWGDTVIVEDVSFDVPAGGRLAVLGRNGVGKTTLFSGLTGIARRRAGSIFLGERDLSRAKTFDRALSGLGLVPQTRDIFRSLTVEENLLAGLKRRPRSALDEAYTLFPRLAERRGNMGGHLSGGEQQMLSVARAILGEPTCLLLDEPLEGLAPVICDQVMAALEALARSDRMTILLIEQQIGRAIDFAERIIILERGRIVWSGDASELKASPETIERTLGVAAMH
ncbi:MAG: ABC transporter ATP-binding protein [Ancalomicrobiaceae bacterium]|nr:ABC transporter ATP-binding protein [Ancalomicrobiaceae bacterium]